MIILNALSKKYGKDLVLHDITVTFNNATIHGLVGPNGCGKTTLMRCICGFTRPTGGTVIVEGRILGKD